MLTGSRIGLAAACGHWLSADAPKPLPETADHDRDFGTIVHASVAELLSGRSMLFDDSITPAQQDRARRCVGHVLDWYEDKGVTTPISMEVGYRYDPLRAHAWRAVPRGPDGYTDVMPGEVPLTVDAFAHLDCGWAVVELKTGKRHPEHAWQARTAALAFACASGLDDVTAVLLYVSEDGVCAIEEHMDVFALDAHAAALRALVRELPTRTDPTPGPHCTALHCPIRTVCSASTAALARVAPAFPTAPAIETDDQARAVLAALPLAEAAIAGWRQRLHDYVRTSPLRLRRTAEDGSLVETGEIYGWRAHSDRRARPITADLRLEMDRILGPDLAAAAVRTTVEATVGSLEEAAGAAARARKAAGEPVKIGAETERIIAQLAEAGVLRVTEHERCEVFRPRPEKGRKR